MGLDVVDVVREFPNGVVLTAAVVVALGVIWRKVVAPVRQWFRSLKAWMERMEVALGWVDIQMKPNSGSSLTDKVNATVVAIEELRTDVRMLLEHDAERDVTGRRYGPTNDEGEQS